jgi:predicted transcriptional regulator of viral defense system
VTTPEVALAELAAGQHGVVTLAQLAALGIGAGAIKYRRRSGRLHLLHQGVYAVGHRPPSPLATAIAAVLACGPDAALSHRSAAALWRIIPRWPSKPEVTAPTKHRVKGIHVHRSQTADATTHYGINVTTPLRTLVDLADVLPPQQLTRALNEAQVQRLTTPQELTTLLTRYPGRRTARLTPERGATKSDLEDDFTRFLKRHHLPLPAQPTDSRPRSRRRLPR